MICTISLLRSKMQVLICTLHAIAWEADIRYMRHRPIQSDVEYPMAHFGRLIAPGIMVTMCRIASSVGTHPQDALPMTKHNMDLVAGEMNMIE